MNAINVINVENLNFKFPQNKRQLRKNKQAERITLKDISFQVNQGDVLGVIGRNGAGKSTLLRVIAGILPPDKGKIQINGTISPVLGLGCGFKPDLSGTDNIYLNGMILGLSKKQIDERLDRIIEFSGLQEYIDMPVKHYSSGMNSRLGFSIAISSEPDILILDEVLSVGDIHFTKKAKAKMNDFMEQARAIVICSHSLNFLKKFCTKIMWIEDGLVKMIGDPAEVVEQFANSE